MKIIKMLFKESINKLSTSDTISEYNLEEYFNKHILPSFQDASDINFLTDSLENFLIYLDANKSVTDIDKAKFNLALIHIFIITSRPDTGDSHGFDNAIVSSTFGSFLDRHICSEYVADILALINYYHLPQYYFMLKKYHSFSFFRAFNLSDLFIPLPVEQYNIYLDKLVNHQIYNGLKNKEDALRTLIDKVELLPQLLYNIKEIPEDLLSVAIKNSDLLLEKLAVKLDENLTFSDIFLTLLVQLRSNAEKCLNSCIADQRFEDAVLVRDFITTMFEIKNNILSMEQQDKHLSEILLLLPVEDQIDYCLQIDNALHKITTSILVQNALFNMLVNLTKQRISTFLNLTRHKNEAEYV